MSFQVCPVCLGRRFLESPLLSLFSFRATVGVKRSCHNCQGRGVVPLTEADTDADWTNAAEPLGFQATTMPGVFNHEPQVTHPVHSHVETAEAMT